MSFTISLSRSPKRLIYAGAACFLVLFLLYHARLAADSRASGAQWAQWTKDENPAVLGKPIDAMALDALPSPRLAKFWAETLDAMIAARPGVKSIKLTRSFPERDIDPKYTHESGRPRLEFINMSASDLGMFQSTHAQMVKSAKELGPRIPFDKRSRGIVMTAGGSYIHNAVLSLQMLRRTGSKLPVQLFIDGEPNESIRHLCQERLFQLGVECHSMDSVFKTTPELPPMKKYQYKVFALLFSSFEDVLFLDADCYPIFNPDDLFDAEPYKSRGLLTWPDVWASSTSPTFYEITGTEAPSLNKRLSSESSVIMLKRSTHGDDLALASYYNLWGPELYYRLLSQGAPGEGDKETFLQAALVLKKPFWDIRTPVGILGRWLNSTYEGYGMKQADPKEDYRLFAHERDDQGHAVLDRKQTLARRMFIHHNNLKVDTSRLDEVMKDVLKKDSFGQMSRLWGDDQTLIDQSGYDVEKAMWEEVLLRHCNVHPAPVGCDRLREYYQFVFVEEATRLSSPP